MLTPRERLCRLVEHLAHVLPAQAPIRDFVHHNTLHGFQHLPFDQALAAVQATSGERAWWPEAKFRAAFAQGRIDLSDLEAALVEAGLTDLKADVLPGISRQRVLLAVLQLPPAIESDAVRAWKRREGAQEATLAELAACRSLLEQPGEVSTNWRASACQRWSALCDRVGRDWTLRALLEHLSGEDVFDGVRGILQRHLAAFLDLGVAAWRNPATAQGFFAAWRASAGIDFAWELDDLPGARDEIEHLPEAAIDVLLDELARLLPDDALWPAYLERLALELPGWSGMFLWRGRNPGRGDGTPVDMLDYLAVRVLLERLLCEDLIRRMTGAPMSFDELRGYYLAEPAEFVVREARLRADLPESLQHRICRLLEPDDHTVPGEEEWAALAEVIAACPESGEATVHYLHALLAALDIHSPLAAGLCPEIVRELLSVAGSLSEAQRGYLWLLAYERHYREQLFAALACEQRRAPQAASPSAQVVMCMDDREEGTRRHLEEIAPDIETYGAAGFFGVAMYWQGLDEAVRTALCPVVVEPQHVIRERAVDADEAAFSRHAARRQWRLRWRELLLQGTRRDPLRAPLLVAVAALPALLGLAATILAPSWFGALVQRWRRLFDGDVRSQVEVTAERAGEATACVLQAGFTDQEQVDRVAAFLRTIGLVDGFAPLVLMLGHGSGSRNNPHLSAYDCGACSGRHGGPNARVFAAMANRPAVRAGLAEQGINIPDRTWFVAAEHNTCDDSLAWYDLAQVPGPMQAALDTLVGQMAEACRAHAAERCRRFASAPPRLTPWLGLRHVQGRAQDISQARPELGHATNAAAFIGRRAMSRGLFLDRRVFLISYDPTQDDAGRVAESILLAAGPVGAGISLEYYFSTVNNAYFGCGSKVTHNLTGQFGVMDGVDSDLRTGLPWQMVEIHEPMRLLVVVEQSTAVLSAILGRQPALQELVGNAWIVLAAKDPQSGGIARYCPRRGWLPWSGPAVLPQVARSAEWFAGESGPLPPARILGALT